MKKIHRFLSLALCLTFLFSFLFSPIRASAITVSPDPYASTAYAVVGGVVVEGFKEGSKLIASAILSVWNTVVTPEFLQTCQGVLEIGSFVSDPLSFKGYYASYSEGEKTAGQIVLDKLFLSNLAAAYKLKTGQTLTVPDEEVTIYVPPESVWAEAELITSDRLNYRGFSDLTEVNQNILAGNQITWQLKKDLNGLELYLRTTFVETLQSEFSSLLSKLSTINGNISTINQNLLKSFESLELSVDTMSSTLSKDISDLKTLYSSFGNATLDKLDTLNTSIQNISLSDLSTDFVNLRDTIIQYDSLTLSALQDLPDLISESLNDFYVTQSQQLEDISMKLGNETSFLESLVGDAQLIRDELSNGFADLKVALESLSVNITAEDLNFDFSPVVDQIVSLEETLVGQLDPLYALINDYLPSLETTILEQFTYISQLYLDEYTANVAYGVSELVAQFESLLADTSRLVEVEVKLGELVDGDLLTVSSFEAGLSNLSQSIYDLKEVLTSDIASFKASVSNHLRQISTAVQSIAGTTTANPPVQSSDLDELNKLEVPLYGAIESGFSQGDEFFGFTIVSLDDELHGFLVASKIFNEFADLTFFKKLIIASASIGFVCSLLGMGLDSTGASFLYYRRREASAQSKAYNRMERGIVVQ